MFKTLGNAWKIADLRKKILYTIFMLLIYRVGVIIPVPGVNASYVAESVGSYTALEFLNMMSGGGLENMSIFALGISPYLNASIVMNLLTIAIPALERLSKDGEDGQKKISKITRYVGPHSGSRYFVGLGQQCSRVYRSLQLYHHLPVPDGRYSLDDVDG